MLSKNFLLSALLLSSYVFAAPTSSPVEVFKRQDVTALSSDVISAFEPFTSFASTAYCQPSTTADWSCGANCDANSDFVPVASGGDGSDVQFWYVGYSPSQGTVIVAHQGTDPSQIQADATDADAFLENLDSSLFPGLDSSIEAHSGFANEQAKTAADVLSAVQATINAYGATAVTIVGHSLGAAIALLDGVFLPLYFDSSISFTVIGYGMPRVGNQAFADYVDATLPAGSNLFRINNKEDIVPIVPGRFLGYHHPSGEIHIMDNNEWVSCAGQDNTSTECSTGDVPNIFDGNTSDHDGPYDGITMGC